MARITIGAICARVTAVVSQYWVALQPVQNPMSRIFCMNLKNGSVAGTSVKYGVWVYVKVVKLFADIQEVIINTAIWPCVILVSGQKSGGLTEQPAVIPRSLIL